MSIVLERLAEAELALGNRGRARRLLGRALPLAEGSTIPSHLVVRIFGVHLEVAEDAISSLHVLRRAERRFADGTRVCEPCSMNFLVRATIACARAADLSRARRYLAEADRITGLWRGGPWSAGVVSEPAEKQPFRSSLMRPYSNPSVQEEIERLHVLLCP
jgi:hypothetical protein